MFCSSAKVTTGGPGQGLLTISLLSVVKVAYLTYKSGFFTPGTSLNDQHQYGKKIYSVLQRFTEFYNRVF